MHIKSSAAVQERYRNCKGDWRSKNPCNRYKFANAIAFFELQNGPLLADDRLALYDAGHRFENIPLLLVLLRTLPFAPIQLQLRVLQVKNSSLQLE